MSRHKLLQNIQLQSYVPVHADQHSSAGNPYRAVLARTSQLAPSAMQQVINSYHQASAVLTSADILLLPPSRCLQAKYQIAPMYAA